jgi:hypothetical protein
MPLLRSLCPPNTNGGDARSDEDAELLSIGWEESVTVLGRDASATTHVPNTAPHETNMRVVPAEAALQYVWHDLGWHR